MHLKCNAVEIQFSLLQ